MHERDLTDAELLYGIAWTTPRGPWLKLIRERYPFEGGPKTSPAIPVDNGTFYPGKLGNMKNIWCCKKDGLNYRATMMGDLWVAYKKTDAYKAHMKTNPDLKE